MSERRKILIVDDSVADAELVVRALRRNGHELIYDRVDTAEAMQAALARENWDVVIADYAMPRFDGIAALKLLQTNRLDLPFILVSGTIGEDVAVEAMKAGASDYILKNNLSRLPHAVEREIRDVEVRREHSRMEARYRSLFERVPVGVFSATPGGAILEANPAFVDMLGFTDAEALKRTDIEGLWLQPAQRVRLKALLATDGVVRNFEMQFRRLDGNAIWCAQNVRAMYNSRGQVDLYESVAVDITERRRAQQELERSNEDLQQFAYVASHDLREPLRMVGGFADLFARRYQGTLDATADEYISYMVDGVQRMEQLIASLLLYSRAGRGEPFTAVDMNKVADRVLLSLSVRIEESNGTVTHGPLLQVEGDEAALFDLLMNLVANAIKFRRDRPPRVKIAAEDGGDEWIFSVADNGIGIEAEYSESIFAMFRRLHTQAEYPGSGIGLATCKRIVERHHGRIWVESRPGEGSTFRFTIPKQPHAGVVHGVAS